MHIIGIVPKDTIAQLVHHALALSAHHSQFNILPRGIGMSRRQVKNVQKLTKMLKKMSKMPTFWNFITRFETTMKNALR